MANEMNNKKSKGKTIDLTDPKYGKYELLSGVMRKESLERMGIAPEKKTKMSPLCPYCKKENTSEFLYYNKGEDMETFAWFCGECKREFVRVNDNKKKERK